MYRCPQSLVAACLFRTQKSLLMPLGDSQTHPNGEAVSHALLSRWFFMLSREKPCMPEPLRLTCISPGARHRSFSCPVTANVGVDSSKPSHSETNQASGLQTSSQFMGSTAVIYSPKATSSEHFTFRDSISSKYLPIEQRTEKHSCSAQTWKSERNTSIKHRRSYHTVTGLTPNLTRTCVLNRTFWTPSPVAQTRNGPLTAQAHGVHRRLPRQAAVEECLSVQNEARCRSHLQPNTALYETQTAKGWAAVLVCLCTVGTEPAFLFTLRSSKLRGIHKGDVSFAGGKRDAVDRSVVDTALREAWEELGVAVTTDEVWGLLKPLRDKSGMLIAPVLANLGPLEALTFHPNPSEVEEIFTLTVAHLCNPQNQGYTHFRTGDRYSYTLPVFHGAKHRVWGLTALAVDHALKVIMPV